MVRERKGITSPSLVSRSTQLRARTQNTQRLVHTLRLSGEQHARDITQSTSHRKQDMTSPPPKRLKKDSELPFDEGIIKQVLKYSIDQVADVLPMMLVCKKWHKCAQDKSLWKSLFFKLFNTEKVDLEHYEGIKDDNKRIESLHLIAEWRYDWFKYWGEDDEEEEGEEEDDKGGQLVFTPPLQVFTNSVTFTNLDLESPNLDFFALAHDFALLERIRKRTENSSLGLGSESDYPFQPFICHFGAGELTEENFLKSIGANKAFSEEDDILPIDLVQESECSDGEEDEEGKQFHEKRMGKWLKKVLPQKQIAFQVGSGKLNPVPFFQVAESPYGTGNVLGVISCLIHT